MSKLLIIAVKDEGDNYSIIYDEFYRSCFTHTYWRGIVPPNNAEWRIGPLSEIGVTRWLEQLERTKVPFSARTEDWNPDA